jgi:uncharacterized repeat protein (TIGR04076 family)
MLEDDIKFKVTVIDTKATEASPCYAGHKIGDTFEFGYLTTEGLCGWAYHAMFPYISALRHTKQYEDESFRLIDKDTIKLCCPGTAWVTFEIKKLPV